MSLTRGCSRRGRSSDGVFQKNPQANAFWHFINTICQLDMLPRELCGAQMEMTAVDLCAKAAVTLLDADGFVYHLYNPHYETVSQILHALNRRCLPVSREEFEGYLKNQAVSASPSFAVFLSQYQRALQIPARIAPTCTATVQALQKRGFTWPPLQTAILLRGYVTEKGC